MRHLALVFPAVLLTAMLAVVALAQEETHVTPGDHAVAPRRFLVTLTEFRADALTDAHASVEATRETFASLPEGAHVQTVRVSVLEHHQTATQLGKDMPIVTGRRVSQQRGGSAAASFEYRNVGTTVSLTASTQGDRILIQMHYDSLRVDAADPDPELPAQVLHRMSCDTALLIAPGGSALVAGSSTDSSVGLMMSIEEVD